MSELLARFHSLPEKVRMIISALLGAMIAWLTYEIIFYVNPLTQLRAVTSWAIAFGIGVFRQHALHRYLTFLHRTPYWESLWKAFYFYSISAIIGAINNLIQTEVLHLNHRFAWLSCLLITSMLSLFGLKRMVFTAQRELDAKDISDNN